MGKRPLRRKYTKKTPKYLKKAIVRTIKQHERKTQELKCLTEPFGYGAAFNSRLFTLTVGQNILKGPELSNMVGSECLIKSVAFKGLVVHTSLGNDVPRVPVQLNVMVIRSKGSRISPENLFFTENNAAQPVPFDYVPNNPIGDEDRATMRLATKYYKIIKKYSFMIYPHNEPNEQRSPYKLINGYFKIPHKFIDNSNTDLLPSSPQYVPNPYHICVWSSQPDALGVGLITASIRFYTYFTDP